MGVPFKVFVLRFKSRSVVVFTVLVVMEYLWVCSLPSVRTIKTVSYDRKCVTPPQCREFLLTVDFVTSDTHSNPLKYSSCPKTSPRTISSFVPSFIIYPSLDCLENILLFLWTPDVLYWTSLIPSFIMCPNSDKFIFHLISKSY